MHKNLKKICLIALGALFITTTIHTSAKTKLKQKSHKKILCLFCVIHLFLDLAPAVGCGRYTKWHSIGENLFFLLPSTETIFS